jgi:uncharacterized heparinase superfamily protein
MGIGQNAAIGGSSYGGASQLVSGTQQYVTMSGINEFKTDLYKDFNNTGNMTTTVIEDSSAIYQDYQPG